MEFVLVDNIQDLFRAVIPSLSDQFMKPVGV
jgi:hypothetical protein